MTSGTRCGTLVQARPRPNWGLWRVRMWDAGRRLMSAEACQRLRATVTTLICFGRTPATLGRGAVGMWSKTSFAIQRSALPALRSGHLHLILPLWPGTRSSTATRMTLCSARLRRCAFMDGPSAGRHWSSLSLGSGVFQEIAIRSRGPRLCSWLCGLTHMLYGGSRLTMSREGGYCL